MVFTYKETFPTRASISAIFEFALSAEQRTKWQKHLSKSEMITPGDAQVGSRFKDTGKGGEMILEFTEIEPNKRIRYSTVEGKGMSVDLKWDFLVTPKGTDVTVEIAMHPRGFLKFMWPIIGKLLIIPQVKGDFKYLGEELKSL